MPIGKRALTALMGLAVCATLAGGVLTGCDLDTTERYEQEPDTSNNNPATSSLLAPDAPNLGTDGGDDREP